MKKEKNKDKEMDINFFNAMSYELAGEIGAIDNEDMLNNRKLVVGKKSSSKRSK
ncbi:MAG: hypothetical protein KGZ81_13690 [Flavobacteriales bacterium]|nr:hypothetical protein [Flavobacteriales bacterium]